MSRLTMRSCVDVSPANNDKGVVIVRSMMKGRAITGLVSLALIIAGIAAPPALANPPSEKPIGSTTQADPQPAAPDQSALNRSGADAVEDLVSTTGTAPDVLDSQMGDSVPLSDDGSTMREGVDINLGSTNAPGAVMRSESQGLEVSFAPTEVTSTQQLEDAMIYHRAGAADVVAHVLPDGAVQMVGVLQDGQDGVQYSFTDSGDLIWQSQEDGGGTLTRGGEIVATVSAPWATDADGKQLPTWYEYQEGNLVQQIDTDGVTYPIVADPKVGIGNGVYFYFNRNEATSIVSLSTMVVSAGAIYSCEKLVEVAGKIPVAKSFVAYACGKLGVSALVSFFKNLPAMMRSYPACTEVRFGGTGQHQAKSVKSSLCQPLNKSWMW